MLLDAFRLALGNIHDAPLRANALEILHFFVNQSEIGQLIQNFYYQEMLGQV